MTDDRTAAKETIGEQSEEILVRQKVQLVACDRDVDKPKFVG